MMESVSLSGSGGRMPASRSAAVTSAAFSLQAAGEKPEPTLVLMMRQRSFSYSRRAVRSLETCDHECQYT